MFQEESPKDKGLVGGYHIPFYLILQDFYLYVHMIWCWYFILKFSSISSLLITYIPSFLFDFFI